MYQSKHGFKRYKQNHLLYIISPTMDSKDISSKKFSSNMDSTCKNMPIQIKIQNSKCVILWIQRIKAQNMSVQL